MQFAISVRIAKFASHKTLAKFRIAKIRNANFAMRKFRNAKFAMRKFRNAKFAMRKFRKANFAMPKPISQCQNTVHVSQPMRNFALRNSQPTLRISQTHFALRNSHCENLQALSSSVINAEPPSIFGLLLLCPIT